MLLLVLAFIGLPGASEAIAAEPIVVSTTATINKGKLIDEYPGPPPPGSTDLDLPFFGRISSDHPACRIRRSYDLGRIEPDGEFVPIGSTTVPPSGKWTFGLAGRISRPYYIAIRVKPRDTVYHGVAYRCEEVTSDTVTEDASDFTPCKRARAAKRGYAPAIRSTKRIIRQAEARNDNATAHAYRRRLKEFKSHRRSIWRAVKTRC